MFSFLLFSPLRPPISKPISRRPPPPGYTGPLKRFYPREGKITLERNFGIIFKNARNTAGLTQERWAESLGVSVDAVQNYEYGRNFPTEETVLLMADLSGYKILPYQYMSMKSRIGGELLPALENRISLPKAVLNLITILNDFQEKGMPELIQLAADGRITENELAEFENCLYEMEKLTRGLYAVKFAKEDP